VGQAIRYIFFSKASPLAPFIEEKGCRFYPSRKLTALLFTPKLENYCYSFLFLHQRL